MDEPGRVESMIENIARAIGYAILSIAGAILILGGPFMLYLLIASFTIGGGWDWPETDRIQTEERGEVLIMALEAYEADHGSYPPKLDNLVPRYLKDVPPPAVDAPGWQYWPQRLRRECFGRAVIKLVRLPKHSQEPMEALHSK